VISGEKNIISNVSLFQENQIGKYAFQVFFLIYTVNEEKGSRGCIHKIRD